MADSSFLPPNLAHHAQAIASSLGVSPAIHPADYIFRWHYDDANTTDKAAVVRNYFEGGRHTAELVAQFLDGFLATSRPFTMLEFASGYGRVTRHWKAVLPQADVDACDVHDDAVDFLSQMGCRACPSSTVPEELAVERSYDVVFALSFFTHMPRATWARWLGALARRIVPGGIFVFTTHGVPSLEQMGVSRLEKDGFWFHGFSEQKDLGTDAYGATATTFDFVYRQLMGCDLDLRHFREGGMGYQDLYVVTSRRETGEMREIPRSR